MTETKKVNLLKMCECAIMLSLSVVLSFIKIIQMPMGGAVTLCSMLPIMLISIKYGSITGASVGFLYSLIQLISDLPGGNVFYAGMSAQVTLIIVLFDYLVPFTVIGFAGILRRIKTEKVKMLGSYLGISLAIILRFVCHFITGFSVWGQWAPDGMNKYYYSLIYNGSYLLPELIITILVAFILLKIPQIKRLLNEKNKNKKI